MDARKKLAELICRFCSSLAVPDITPPYGYENLADYLISNGVTVQEWISVEDRLPEKHDRFICTYKFNSNSEMQFVGVLDYYAYDQYPHWQHESAGVIVTHWMPLPEPPKEDE